MTQPKFRIKKGDFVQVISGKDRGVQGKVEKVMLEESRVVVEGVHLVTKHVKPSAANPSGGLQRKALPIHISKVALVDPTTNSPGKVGYKIEDGKKVRYFKKTGTVLSTK